METGGREAFVIGRSKIKMLNILLVCISKRARVPQGTEFGCARNSSLVPKPSRMCGVLCDIFVTWDGAILEF